VYRQADVVAMASISEAFPYSVIESMLTGAAIVATDVGGVREAVGSCGVLVNPRDPAALSRAIVGLLHSPGHRRRLGEEARARALRSFTEDRFVAEYRDTYSELTGTQRDTRLISGSSSLR
jgi:glycosyltransferase involved in cell wall biosynthesis